MSWQQPQHLAYLGEELPPYFISWLNQIATTLQKLLYREKMPNASTLGGCTVELIERIKKSLEIYPQARLP